ncbi:MAG: hypothetical protein JW839_14270 [Candidatus Lokiarchaeota archaeon]|nr:hypothetical protein [Candidatus Lokiarchaeota archaeon]
MDLLIDWLPPAGTRSTAKKPPYQNCFSCPRKRPCADEECKRCAELLAASAPRYGTRPAWLDMGQSPRS